MSSRQKYPIPYILVGLEPTRLGFYDIVVTVEEQPRVIASNPGVTVPEALCQQLVKWKNLNQQALYKLWDLEIDTGDFFLQYHRKI